MAGWDKVKLVACGGQEKALGLIAHEAVSQAGVTLGAQAEVVCLARIVVGNSEVVAKIDGIPCITVDGCERRCAAKSLEIFGGDVRRQIVVADETAKMGTEEAGIVAGLTGYGLQVTDSIAKDVVVAVKALNAAGGKV